MKIGYKCTLAGSRIKKQMNVLQHQTKSENIQIQHELFNEQLL